MGLQVWKSERIIDVTTVFGMTRWRGTAICLPWNLTNARKLLPVG